MISHAPASAASAVSTSFPGSMDPAAMDKIFPSVASCAHIISARGPSPRSLAFVARVLFFCLNGLYRSSTLCSISACSISLFSSSVSFPCSSMLFMTSAFLSSRPLRYESLSSRSRSSTSVSPPVTSLR